MRLAVGLSLALCLASLAPAQNQTVSDQQALTLAAQAITAMTGGIAVTDITVSGNATWIAGSDYETGTATLLAKGTTESRVVLNLGSGTRTEIRNALSGFTQGKWLNPNGASGLMAWHNCQTDVAWFFPVLSSLANLSNPVFIFSYVGQESWNGLPAYHLTISQRPPANSKAALPVQALTAMDFYLDSGSLLPLAVDFNAHPDTDMNSNIPMEIRFASYQVINGIRIPFHIQRLINGGLSVDLVFTSAAINSGLSDSQFSF